MSGHSRPDIAEGTHDANPTGSLALVTPTVCCIHKSGASSEKLDTMASNFNRQTRCRMYNRLFSHD